MALAIDASTPAVTVSTGGSATITQPSFTPAANSLLLIRWSWNQAIGDTPAVPTITDNLGSHLTYTLVDHQSKSNQPLVPGQVATWTAPVATATAMTISVTAGAGTTGHDGALQVTVITGHYAADPVGAHGASGSASTSSIGQSYAAQASGGWGFLVVCDWSEKGPQTAGSGCTLESSADVATAITYGFLRRTSADDVNGGGNTLNVNLPATSVAVNWAWVEIVPVAPVAPDPPVALTGFEFGTVAGWTTGNAGNVMFDSATAGTSIIAGGADGSYCMRCTGASSSIVDVKWTTATLGTSKNVHVRSFAVRFPTILPTTDVGVVRTEILGTHDGLIQFQASTGKLQAVVGTGTPQNGPAVVPDRWYTVDYRYDCSGATTTIDWQVDGIAYPQATISQTASTLVSSVYGWDTASTGTVTIDYDDIVDSVTASDYPFGPQKVLLLKPDTAATATEIGTANATTTFTANGTVGTTFSSANLLSFTSEVPPTIGASANGFAQRTSGTTNAANIPMTSVVLGPGETVTGVRIEIVGWSASATANTIEVRGFDGTTETVIFPAADPNFDNSTTTPAWLCRMYTQAAGWSQAQLDAFSVRLGYSASIVPVPGAHAVYAEVAIKQVPGGPVAAPQQLPQWLLLELVDRQQQLHDTAPVVAAPAPVFVAQPSVPRRLRGLSFRRGEAWAPVPAQVIVPPVYVPQPARARIRTYGLKRDRGPQIVPDQVVVAPAPFVPAPVRVRVKWWQPRRRAVTLPADQASPVPTVRLRTKPAKPARGKTAQPVPPQVVTPPPFPPQTLRARLKLFGLRRSKPAQLVGEQPPTPAVSRTRPKPARLFRGRQAQPVPAQTTVTPPAYPPQTVRGRLKLFGLRRSKPVEAIPPQVVVTPPPYPPQTVHARLLRFGLRRGKQAQPTPPQIVASPPPYPPQTVHARLARFGQRRGKQAQPTPAQITVTPPAWVPSPIRARTRMARLFRGRQTAPPPLQTAAAPPTPTRPRPRFGWIRRGRTPRPVPPQVILIPPPYPPQGVRGRRLRWWLPFRRRGRAEVFGHICDTTQPDTGTTHRPGTGTTAYNLTGTTRPGTGTTTRPDTGTTTEPC